jgi:serine/threonine-protein kinase
VYDRSVELRPGDRVDRYTLVELLGKGGQGSVWKIVDPAIDVVRALKLIDPARLPPNAVDRARIEVDAARQAADHPAIVPCHAFVHLPDGRLGLVFDLVRGEPLHALLDDARFTADHRLAVLDQLAAVLAHIHARGVAHRDLKPENVLLTEAFWSAPRTPGNVKLVDFGTASLTAGPSGLTRVGSYAGTLPYLAPEVLLPDRWPVARSGFARDVFAYGVLNWELLAGAHPTGLGLDAPEQAYRSAYIAAADGRVSWPPAGVASPMGEVLRGCLALDPSTRLADGAAIERSFRTATMTPRDPRRAGATKPHRAPTDPGGMEATRPDPTSTAAWSQRSAPVSSLGPSVLIGPPAPLPIARRSIPSWLPWLVTAALAIGGTMIFLAFLVLGAQGEGARSTPSPAAPPPRETPVVTPPPAQPATPVPCCSSGSTCSSGRTCTPSPCTPDGLPERWWRLRITGVAGGREPAFREDLGGTHPWARVCLHRKANPAGEVCAPLTKIVGRYGDVENRLRVHTSDLKRGGVEIRIEEGATLLDSGTTAPNFDGLTTKILCGGLRLYVGPRDTATHIVRGYLDDD